MMEHDFSGPPPESRIPGPESWLLAVPTMLSGLFFLGGTWCAVSGYIGNDPHFVDIWPVLLAGTYIIDGLAIATPILWTLMVWWGRFTRPMYLVVTALIGLGVWVANVVFIHAFSAQCPTCYFG
ncbi:MAG TPA: hypothetical protein VM536_04895 [Chloroflexia bacterium]|nr:hypothetical protein [Chloroflexia bacterium]